MLRCNTRTVSWTQHIQADNKATTKSVKSPSMLFGETSKTERKHLQVMMCRLCPHLQGGTFHFKEEKSWKEYRKEWQVWNVKKKRIWRVCYSPDLTLYWYIFPLSYLNLKPNSFMWCLIKLLQTPESGRIHSYKHKLLLESMRFCATLKKISFMESNQDQLKASISCYS